jgi:peptidoglycan/xylan/chitin deacetylase (PgdA/CDA1 family)
MRHRLARVSSAASTWPAPAWPGVDPELAEHGRSRVHIPWRILLLVPEISKDGERVSETLAADAPERASFVLSLDTELMWGSFHRMSPAQFEAGYPDVRGVIRAVLSLLDRYEVPATWAVVGHLFLEDCERGSSGLAHAGMIHPKQSWWSADWYEKDPCTDRERDHLWYGPDILDMIQGASTAQEIGSHSFAHPHFGDPEMSREAAASDLDACIDAARDRGIQLRSFVFPANSEGHHHLLQERGFRAYRGTGPEELRVRRLPKPLQRPVRLATQIVGARPLVGKPVETLPGLWDIPASMLLLTRTGLRKLSTHQARLRRVRAGISAASRSASVFHLWTHPWNMADDPTFHLNLLHDILEDVARAREAGQLRVETMGQLADRLSRRSTRKEEVST